MQHQLRLIGAPPLPPLLGPNAQAPLVGSVAPEFTATAVIDQEFEVINLSQYRVSCSWFRVSQCGRLLLGSSILMDGQAMRLALPG